MTAYEHLLKYDIKPSSQRIVIMDYLLNNRTHPTSNDIYNALKDDNPTLSKTTVYNTLKLFEEKGAVLNLSIDEKNAHFDGDTSDQNSYDIFIMWLFIYIVIKGNDFSHMDVFLFFRK